MKTQSLQPLRAGGRPAAAKGASTPPQEVRPAGRETRAPLREGKGELLLEVQGLTVHYLTRSGRVRAVEDLSFQVRRGEALGLVGESGSGKTTVANAILRILPENARVERGRILFRGLDLTRVGEAEMEQVRWRAISAIFQGAMNALAPVYRVGEQVVETIVAHEPDTPLDEARKQVGRLFELVGLEPERTDHFPHQFSGGMRQRAVIALALACDPELVIADEPTTALDVIVQDRILRALDDIRRRLGVSFIYISHDIAVIAEVADRIGVMYAGRLAEVGPVEAVLRRPRHPYTAGLIAAFPSLQGERRRLATIPGEPPDPASPPPGCPFHPRCQRASARCAEAMPTLEPAGAAHQVACWHPLEGG